MQNADWWNALFTAIDGRRTQDFVTFLTEDGEFRFGSAPAVRGRTEVAAAVDGFIGMIGWSRHEVLHTWGDATTAVCEGTVTYGRLDGSQVTLPFVNVFHLRGREIARYLIYIDSGPLFA